MKKVLLSTVTITTLLTTSSFADGVIVKSKAATLKFNGTHYLGFVHEDPETGDGDDYFETRRNYFQVKAYINDNPKDYMRITMDTHNEKGGEVNVRLKYAYLYLDNILPNTGVEMGQVHRPWIDYEEHHGWLYRSIAKTFVEEHSGAHFTNSADKGINFKTKTEGFSSEIGLFNGEGYHGSDDDGENGLSFEWRLTSSLYGTGKKHVHPEHDTYADISFLGQYNTKTLKNDEDFIWYGFHAVYNQPQFLVAAMYVQADDKGVANNSKTGNGFTLNGEYRVDHKWTLLGRYDSFGADDNKDREEIIAGVAYKYSKNVKFIANIFHIDKDTNTDDDAKDKYMLTAEVKW
jgi:hypothetical protein